MSYSEDNISAKSADKVYSVRARKRDQQAEQPFHILRWDTVRNENAAVAVVLTRIAIMAFAISAGSRGKPQRAAAWVKTAERCDR